MSLTIPVPTDSPQNDILQYVPLLLSAIEGFLEYADIWEETDYVAALDYMEELKRWIVENMPPVDQHAIGEIIMFAHDDLPAKWLPCDGQAVSRTTYAELWALIGYEFGNGNGTTTFNLPDLRARVPLGGHVGVNIPMGGTGGEFNHTLTEAELPAHTHPAGAGTAFVMRAGSGNGLTPGSGATVPLVPSTANTGSRGSGTAHNNMPPYQVIGFAIYAGV